MKYIVLKSSLAGMEQKIPIIFPNFMVHSFVAKYIAGMLIRQHGHSPNITVASAGSINLISIVCFGDSESCKTKSDPNDANLISMFEYFQGLEPDPEIEQTLRSLFKLEDS